MPHILSKSHIKSRPRTASLQRQASNAQNMATITHSFGSALPAKMASRSSPVAIGTIGTVGSLIMQEIDYFSRLQLSHDRSISKKPSSSGELSKPVKKKRGGSKRYVPSMCSMVEVAEINQPKPSTRFTYRKLKADGKRSQP